MLAYTLAALAGALALAVIVGSVMLGWSLGQRPDQPTLSPGGSTGLPVAEQRAPALDSAAPQSASDQVLPLTGRTHASLEQTAATGATLSTPARVALGLDRGPAGGRSP
jgi:hypothetical protein